MDGQSKLPTKRTPGPRPRLPPAMPAARRGIATFFGCSALGLMLYSPAPHCMRIADTLVNPPPTSPGPPASASARARMPTPRHGGGHALLAALLASSLAAASAQPGVNDDYMSGGQVHVSTAMIALLAAVVAVFVFIAFFTVYLRHCTGGYPGRYSDGDRAAAAVPNFDAFISRSRRQRRPRGLDAEVVEAFPTMRYAEARALRVGKGGGALECAVCLSEFEDEERLRLLPKCSHAFHPDCIGEWLASHVTCPVCRCNLDPNVKDNSSDEEPSSASIPVASSISSGEVAVARQGDGGAPLPVAAVVIDVVTEEEAEERRQEALELQQIGTQRRAMRSRSRSGRRPVAAATQLARSHSTGHSLAVRLDRDMERFTLRLPEHMRREMVAAAAAAASEQYSSQPRRGRRAGEGSSRGGGRSAPLGRPADRWQSLLARTFSEKLSFFSFSASRMTVSSDRGEVSSSSSTRLRGKRVAAVDATDVDRIGAGGAASREVAAEADEEKAVTQQLPT